LSLESTVKVPSWVYTVCEQEKLRQASGGSRVAKVGELKIAGRWRSIITDKPHHFTRGTVDVYTMVLQVSRS
jgi:hypothetical protein